MDKDPRLLSTGDLWGLLALGYRLGGCGDFREVVQTAVDEIPALVGKDCWAAIVEFTPKGEVLEIHVGGCHRQMLSDPAARTISEGMTAGPPLTLEAWQELGQVCMHAHRASGHPEILHRACQWVAVSPAKSAMLVINRRTRTFSQREIALIGEAGNQLAAVVERFRHVEAALRFAEAVGEGSPVCGWVEADAVRLRPLRMAGPAEGWLAALRTSREGASELPTRLRKAMTTREGGELLSCPGVPEPGLQVMTFPGLLPGRVMVILRHPVCRPVLAADLTRREREVLSLAGTGRSRGEIALQLGIATRTVDKHLEHIHGKSGVGGHMEALLSMGM